MQFPFIALIRRRFRLGRANSGFSLPETTIAVGIAALGIISLLGLLPQGLEMSRKTISIATEAHILQDVINDLQAADWSQVPSFATDVRSYDDQGVRLSGMGEDLSWVTYVAKVEIPASGSTMPGAPNVTPDPYLRRIIIKTAPSTRLSFDFSDNNRRQYSTHAFLLSKSH